MAPSPPQNLLLTGPPGCGKTTVIRRAVEGISDSRLAGFYTQEIREHGRRVGFQAIGLSGGSAVLAHVRFRGTKRVGRYVVELGGFESLVREELGKPAGEVDLRVIDEIGKMECFSRVFVEHATAALDDPVPLLAVIAFKGGGFIAQVKSRPDVEIRSVTAANRDELPERLLEALWAG
jgi:nucleoside-triphosphatase